MNLKSIFKWGRRKQSTTGSQGSVCLSGTSSPAPNPSVRISASPSPGPHVAASGTVLHHFIQRPASATSWRTKKQTASGSSGSRTSLASVLKLLGQSFYIEAFGPLKEAMESLLWFMTENEASTRYPHSQSASKLKSTIIIQKVVTKQQEYEALCAQFDEIFKELYDHLSDNNSPVMTTSMCNICSAIQREIKMMDKNQDRNVISRYLQATEDLNDEIGSYRRIQIHLERLLLNVNMKTWRVVDELKTEALLTKIAPAMSASYNSAEATLVRRRECARNTREQVLLDLTSWRCSPDGEKVCWLSGMAGTGKTTIVTTLCKLLDDNHELGASFFCTRSLPECRNVKLIMPTIAYQLARFSRPFRSALSRCLERDPDVHTKALRFQFERMILVPLREIARTLSTGILVVIDALDECEDSDGVEQILQVLLEYASGFPIKFLVSSRPEPHIRDRIGASTMKAQLTLHELDDRVVKADIETYLRDELASVSLTEDQLAILVMRAGVLFIYAATVVRYIKNRNSTSAPRRLDAVLKGSDRGKMTKKNKEVDGLYEFILTTALHNPELEEEERERVELVLHTVVCAQEPLVTNAMAELLKLYVEEVEEALRPLWSVLHVSGSGKMQRISTLHASFPDYLLDPSRSKGFACNAEAHNGKLAELCFDRIGRNHLQFNICALESSYLFDEEVPDMDEKVKQEIPFDLLYACQYWAAHLGLGERSAKQSDKLYDFLSKRLLLWIEVLNLKKKLLKGIESLEKTKSWLEWPDSSGNTKALAHDSWRFITMFATSPVSESTPHLYVSMLNFWPESQPVSSCYVQRTAHLVGAKGIKGTTRQLSLLSMIPIPADSHAKSVRFSPTGTLIAAGTEDGAVLIWDAQSCKTTIDPLRGHTGSVRAVAFSPDGAQVCSGSKDGTLRVWDPRKGKLLASLLSGDFGAVLSVDYSPDGLRLASGLEDGTICVWGTKGGQIKENPLIIVGNDGSIHSLAFLPDGSTLSSGSSSTIRFWDSSSGRCLGVYCDGKIGVVKTISFSPNGKYLVSGSEDHVMRVWDVEDKKVICKPFQDTQYSPRSVSFSHDGAFVASASSLVIRIWDTRTWQTLLVLWHTDWVHSISFSPDSSRLVSVSEDKTARVWDLKNLDQTPTGSTSEGHNDWVRSICFSPCGEYIISGSDDCTIRMWNARNGQQARRPYIGHAHRILSVGASANGTQIVSRSEDRSIRVWDPKSRDPDIVIGPFGEESLWRDNEIWPVAFSPDGLHVVSGYARGVIHLWNVQDKKLLFEVVGHDDLVSTISFTPDGHFVVSGSWDNTLRVWDARCGALQAGPLAGHHDRVYSLAISPDGSRVASGSEDMTIIMWSLQSIQPIGGPLRGHTSGIHSISFSPDGTLLVSGSRDKTVRLWDPSNTCLLATFHGHTDIICSVGFSPDNASVVSASGDMAIRLWDVRPEKLIPRDAPCSEGPEGYQGSFGPKAGNVLAFDWMMDEDGWVRDYLRHTLIWVPPDLRSVLLRPQNTMLMSAQGCVELEFAGARIGNEWATCFQPL